MTVTPIKKTLPSGKVKSYLRIVWEPGELEQESVEWAWWLDFVKGAHSILEIGSRSGASLLAMAKVAAPGAKLRAIDDGSDLERLTDTIDELDALGFDAVLLHADSHDQVAVDFAHKHAPYDVVFIDGDHSFAGVSQDWESYGVLGKVVGFHDIDGRSQGVSQLWSLLKASHRTMEKISYPGDFGIGVVFEIQS